MSDTVTSKWHKGTGGPSGDECQNLVSFYPTGGSQSGFAREDLVSPTLKRGSGVGAESGTAVAYVNALDRQAGGADDNSAQAGHLVSDQSIVRRLTPTECERLMGLRDQFTAPPGVKASDSKRYAACGDAIVVNVAYWIAQRIMLINQEQHDAVR